MVAPARTKRYKKWTDTEYRQFMDALSLHGDAREELREIIESRGGDTKEIERQIGWGWRARQPDSLYNLLLTNIGKDTLHRYIDRQISESTPAFPEEGISINTFRTGFTPVSSTEFRMHDTHFIKLGFKELHIEKASQIDFVGCHVNRLTLLESDEIKFVRCEIDEPFTIRESTVSMINSNANARLLGGPGELHLEKGSYTLIKDDIEVLPVIAANCSLSLSDKNPNKNWSLAADKCKIRVAGNVELFQATFHDCVFWEHSTGWSIKNCDFKNCDLRGQRLENADNCRFVNCKYDGKPPPGYTVKRGKLV